MADAEAAPHLPPLREVIARYRLSARKSLGQHFLLDARLTDHIARAAGDLAGTSVIEIGSGPGGLSRALLARGAREVVAVERDARCVEHRHDFLAFRASARWRRAARSPAAPRCRSAHDLRQDWQSARR